jgi:hypothetical protein
MEMFRLKKAIFISLLIANFAIEVKSNLKCDRTPEGTTAAKAPHNGNFRLSIENSPARYQPDVTYNSEYDPNRLSIATQVMAVKVNTDF